MSAELRAVLEELIDYERHNCLCPAAEWSGTRPACDCDWDELEAAARAALASTSIDGVSGTGLEAAWREVEAVLPEGAWLYLAKTSKGRYGAQMRGAKVTGASGDSPAAALRALAERLRAALAKDGDGDG